MPLNPYGYYIILRNPNYYIFLKNYTIPTQLIK